jgi:hypothetical protein
MTQGWTRSRNIGVWCAAVAIAAGLAVCGVLPASAEHVSEGNRLFFRGGYAALNSSRGGELFTDVHTGQNNGTGGYYIGAGEDIMVTNDLWGMMKGIALVGEIGVEFKRWNSNTVTNSEALVGNLTPAKVQLTMLTVDIAPKIKFRHESDLQPWIIPVGLDFHVISPPSNQTTVLDIGVQFGAGVGYRVWKELWLGMDTRYHVTSNQTNTVNNFWTIGNYVAIGF